MTPTGQRDIPYHVMWCVLVLARIELIFLLVAGRVLCLGFRMSIMLMFNCCRAALTLSQGLFSFSHCSDSEEAGGVTGAGRGQNQDR